MSAKNLQYNKHINTAKASTIPLIQSSSSFNLVCPYYPLKPFITQKVLRAPYHSQWVNIMTVASKVICIYVFLADPGEARGCAINSLVIN